MDSHELFIAMERAFEARRSLKEFLKGAGTVPQSSKGKSQEAALLERVAQTRNDFEMILGKYIDARIEAALSKGRE